MAKLKWGYGPDRLYEVGLDRGVLYLDNNVAVPWNGLTEVSYNTGSLTDTPVFFDGKKYGDISSTGELLATISALTYPDEFTEYTGHSELESGLSVSQQHRKPFSMSYRSLIGNGVVDLDLGYKIHILYNLMVQPMSISNDTVQEDLAAMEFSWTATSKQEKVDRYIPTAYVIADSRFMTDASLLWLEYLLYGTAIRDPYFPSLSALLELLEEAFLMTITDRGDGTWIVEGPQENITMLTDTTFQITGIDVVVLDPDTYSISST